MTRTYKGSRIRGKSRESLYKSDSGLLGLDRTCVVFKDHRSFQSGWKVHRCGSRRLTTADDRRQYGRRGMIGTGGRHKLCAGCRRRAWRTCRHRDIIWHIWGHSDGKAFCRILLGMHKSGMLDPFSSHPRNREKG